MTLFRRKPAKPARPDAEPKGGDGKQPAASHRVAMDLARVEALACMLASSRASNAVEVADLLAGMYIYEWDRLSRYWDDPEEVEAYLRQICRISPQRWHYWIQFYDRKRYTSEPQPKWRPGRKIEKPDPEDKLLPRTTEVEDLLRRAEVITPFRDNLDGKPIPILTSESVLLAIALNQESEIARKLKETGLDLASLEQAARDRRRAPQKWRDDSESKGGANR